MQRMPLEDLKQEAQVALQVPFPNCPFRFRLTLQLRR